MSELPGRPNIDQLRRQARELLRAAADGEPAALARVRAFSERVSLSAAQLAVAREYGFASWPALPAEVERRLAELPPGEGEAGRAETGWSFGGGSPIETVVGRDTETTLTKQGEQLDKTLKAQSEQLDRTLAEQRTRTLNERFDTVAEQLGSDKPPAVRLAAVYAMAGLADDWQDHRQMCVDVLCAYLRMPYEPGPGDDAPVEKRLAFQASREVRHTVIRVITAHLNGTAPVSWCGLNFDFAGAVFDGGDFSGAKLSGGTVNFSNAEFSGGTVNFAGAEFSGGTVNFSRPAAVNFSNMPSSPAGRSTSPCQFPAPPPLTAPLPPPPPAPSSPAGRSTSPAPSSPARRSTSPVPSSPAGRSASPMPSSPAGRSASPVPGSPVGRSTSAGLRAGRSPRTLAQVSICPIHRPVSCSRQLRALHPTALYREKKLVTRRIRV